MKTKLLLVTLLVPTLSFAQSLERKFEALIRTEKNKPVVTEVVLKDLTSAEAFEGAHFKIVRGKSDEAIKFTDDKALTFRAATTYYHLTKAREYFVNHMKSKHAAAIPQMTIRIDHTNQFSELGHFAHDNMEPQYNNALTVPAGKGLESRGVKPWGTEIWFRPSKKIHVRDLRVNNTANREMQVLMKQFRNQTHMQSLQRFLLTTVLALTEDGVSLDPKESIIRTVGASVIIEVGYQAFDPITKAFSRKWYWLDTAVVPEIIYHEYAHVALSDHLVLSHSTAIIEGMADFFAGQIANSPELAKHIKKYNTYSGKDAERKQDYMIQFEMTEYANTDFVFGMLWSLKEILGEEKGEAFMFDLRKKLTTNSTIRGQLIEGILQTCEESCASPFVDKLRILKALNLRGI
ncbi:hypothetical protein [Peredibacter starrii]|uniref:DUF1570 domain-containing protein n=1 Tax=Peredibacter starrii TaxID=28202 RepID=A0AAX4HL39_9BACT|nr:hypothetical protein [Peredibacter starrii]WPU63936.1 hypothetical protein SOO65_14670 [Peredibacter starrii]